MPLSLAVTALIVGVVWSTVWAQQIMPSSTATAAMPSAKIETQPAAQTVSKPLSNVSQQSKAIVSLSLVGISSLSNYESAEQTAQKLFSKFTESTNFVNQLKDIEQINIYLVYRAVNNKQLQISAAVETKNLKKSHFESIGLAAGDYQPLAKKGSNTQQLINAWQHLDKQRMFKIVLENYRLDNQGNFIDGYSFVNYQ